MRGSWSAGGYKNNGGPAMPTIFDDIAHHIQEACAHANRGSLAMALDHCTLAQQAIEHQRRLYAASLSVLRGERAARLEQALQLLHDLKQHVEVIQEGVETNALVMASWHTFTGQPIPQA